MIKEHVLYWINPIIKEIPIFKSTPYYINVIGSTKIVAETIVLAITNIVFQEEFLVSSFVILALASEIIIYF